MKFLKKAVLVLLVLAVLIAGIGFLLPSTYHVERSISIHSPPAAIVPYLNKLRKWPEWIPWNTTRYPDMKQEFHEPDEGAGASYSWTGKSSGNGTLKITRSDPEKGIAYDLDFENGKHLSHGEIKIERSGEDSKVTWTNEGDLGNNPIGRYFGLLMDKFMGPDFQQGLETLKAKVEAPAK
jgi:hypothetical protein